MGNRAHLRNLFPGIIAVGHRYLLCCPHIAPLFPCFLSLPQVLITQAEVFDIMCAEASWDRLLQEYISVHDRSKIMENYKLFLPCGDSEDIVAVPLSKALFSSCTYPYCLSSQLVQGGVIIVTGASVCISPHRSDFITYKESEMKLRDLSSSNKVAGEGIIHWLLQDKHDNQVAVELPGYHIPTADVRLLRPQILLKTIGGQCHQTISHFDVTLILFSTLVLIW